MQMQIQPYLFFDGRCEEALNYYREVLGAEVTMMMRFSESPEPVDPAMVPPGSENKIMHASVRIGESTVNMSDGGCMGQAMFQGFALSLQAPDDAKAERLFATLAQDGQIRMPMASTFFSSRFGIVADRFGVSWMVIVPN
jgi:PhnB protein